MGWCGKGGWDVGGGATPVEELESELHLFEVAIATYRFEVRLALACCSLEGIYYRLSLQFVGVEGSIYIGVLLKRVRKRDGIFHRQLRPRANGEVGCMNSIAKQHHFMLDLGFWILDCVMPFLCLERGEANPLGVVGEEWNATQVFN